MNSLERALEAWDAFRGENDLDSMIGFVECAEAMNTLRSCECCQTQNPTTTRGIRIVCATCATAVDDHET
jgi:hypothetical protein